MDGKKSQIAAVAARMVVEEGLDYGAAKRRAVRQLGLRERTPLPDNDLLEAAVQEYIEVFCAESQPGQLRALRLLALEWMRRLQEFRPFLGGAVWRGTATRHSDIYLHLYCDDSKSAEISLIDQGVRFDARQVAGPQGAMVDALSVHIYCAEIGEHLGLHLLVHDLGDLRGALAPDRRGRRTMGDVVALELLLSTHAAHEN
jgi:hypothetical protein